MNKKQFEIWEKQKRREYEIELERLQNDFAERGLTFSGVRNQTEKDLKAKYDNEIETTRLGVERTKPNWQKWGVMVAIVGVIVTIFIFVLDYLMQKPTIQQEGIINTVGQVGDNEVSLTQNPAPILIIDKVGTSTQQYDGLFRTSFTLLLFNAAVTDPRYEMKLISPIIGCDKTQNEDVHNIYASRKETNNILTPGQSIEASCLSTMPIINGNGLFQYVKK